MQSASWLTIGISLATFIVGMMVTIIVTALQRKQTAKSSDYGGTDNRMIGAELEQCIAEIEGELIRVGRTRHEFLREESRQSAVILLLLRCISLFGVMLRLLRDGDLDALDAVRRAYLESWLLAFQFRVRVQEGDAGRWLARRSGSWQANIRQLEEYSRSRGNTAPDLLKDYRKLSELAHPTRDAAENSAAILLWRLGLNEDGHIVEEAIANLNRSFPAMLYRLLWLALDNHPSMVPLQSDERNAGTAVRFCEQFQRI